MLYAYLFTDLGWRQACLFLVGLAAGVILITQLSALPPRGERLRDGPQCRPSCANDYARHYGPNLHPINRAGEIFGIAVRGSVAPVNLAWYVAFIFGIGMQLRGMCSGTLFTAGGGNLRMLITLAGFIAGSVTGLSLAKLAGRTWL